MDGRVPDRQPRRDRQLRPAGLGHGPRVVPVGRRRLRRLGPRLQDRRDRGRPVRRVRRGLGHRRDPHLRLADRGRFNIEGVDELDLDPATIAGHLRRHDHELERPGDRRDQRRRRRCPTSRSRPSTAPTSRARRELHRLPRPDGRDVWTYELCRGVADPGRRGRSGHLGCRQRHQGRQRHDRLRRPLADR